MAQARLSVRKIREVLRLKAEARLSDREIAAAIGSARSTVQECLRRARAAGIAWPLPAECDEEALAARLYPHAPTPARYPTPDFATVHAELARKGVTRMLLWQEYRARHPDGCQYSAFCRDYDAWRGRQDAGDALRARAGRQAVRRLRRAHDEHRRARAAARCRRRRSSSPRSARAASPTSRRR